MQTYKNKSNRQGYRPRAYKAQPNGDQSTIQVREGLVHLDGSFRECQKDAGACSIRYMASLDHFWPSSLQTLKTNKMYVKPSFLIKSHAHSYCGCFQLECPVLAFSSLTPLLAPETVPVSSREFSKGSFA